MPHFFSSFIKEKYFLSNAILEKLKIYIFAFIILAKKTISDT
jgi:hypothetical protein